MTFDPTGSILFQPFEIGRLRLANRIVLPAMVTRLSGADGFVNDDVRDRHIDSARGGAHRFEDGGALFGARYRYRIVAYDLAGNRSSPLGPVEVTLDGDG